MKNKNLSQLAKKELTKAGHECFMVAVDAEIRPLYHLQQSEWGKRSVTARKRKQCTD